ncbi:MAG: hypothetical protein BWK73_23945 [Thiothrix lacustris]|uniref:TonB-dependent siderophore receptor n=1 Tax=Thiothrix lacustris TaxID=525917 RepID=A0A1Y1QMG2_9GAMM|nr:MAG: hypothetical protein BWK73_23945 [Thiothrix lacustris]
MKQTHYVPWLYTALGCCIDSYAATPDTLVVNIHPPYKSPHTSMSISAADASKIGSDRLEDFADYLTGVQIGRNQAGIGSDIYVRGYSLNGAMTLDGLMDVQGFYLRDPATLARTDISKGRDSVLSGAGSPGGAANYVSKKPSFKPQRSLSVSTGTPQQFHTVLDINQALSHPNWAGRFIMAGQQADTGHANVGDDRFTLLPSLLWQTEQQSLLLAMEYGWQNREYDFDTVFYQGKPVYNVSYVDPRSFADRRVARFGATYTRDLGKGWETSVQASRMEAERDERWIGFAYLPASGSRLPGYFRDAQYAQTQQGLRAEIAREYAQGTTQHHTRFGVSQQAVDIEVKRQYRTGLFTLDIFQPSFDFALPDASKLTQREATTVRDEQGWYLHHQADIGDTFGLTAGLRRSHYDADYLSPTTSFKEVASNDTSASIGATWQATPQWQAFASRNESFAPNLGMDKNEQFFAPLQGVQHELGIRHQHGSVSAYQIKQENVTTRDPTEPGAQVLTGKTRSKGIEANLKIPLTPKLSVKTGYQYNDSRITANNDGNTGKRLHNVPQHSGSLLLDYAPNAQTHLTLGAVRVGKRAGDDANSFDVPAYTRLDAGAEWQLNKQTTLKASVRNLLDEDYVAAVEGADFVVQGRKRTLMLGIEVAF